MPVSGRGPWLPSAPEPVFTREGQTLLGVRVVELENQKIRVLLLPYEEEIGTGTFHRSAQTFAWFECNLPTSLREAIGAAATKILQAQYPKEVVGKREDDS